MKVKLESWQVYPPRRFEESIEEEPEIITENRRAYWRLKVEDEREETKREGEMILMILIIASIFTLATFFIK
jgi:hypothetical protein